MIDPLDLIKITGTTGTLVGDPGAFECFQGRSVSFTAESANMTVSIPQPLQVTFPTPVAVSGVTTQTVEIPQPLIVDCNLPQPFAVSGCGGTTGAETPPAEDWSELWALQDSYIDGLHKYYNNLANAVKMAKAAADKMKMDDLTAATGGATS